MLRRFLPVLLLVSALAAQTAPPPLVGIGDSLGEGVQSANSSDVSQPHSYLNLIAQQAGVAFPLPLIDSSPLGFIYSVSGRNRIDPTVVSPNLAVSGSSTGDILNRTYTGGPIVDEYGLVLSPRTGSQITIAESLKPFMIVCWAGNDDVLSAALAYNQYDASQMTSVADFTANYGELIQRLKAVNRGVVLANIPDVSNIGFLFNNDDLIKFTGKNFNLPAGSYTSLVAMLLLKLGLNDGSILQNPSWVLDATEAGTIQQRLTTFNQIIAADAAAAGFPVVNVNGLFASVGANPPVILGVKYTDRYNGGIFSLDGVHPSDSGHAVLANEFIQTMNNWYHLNIPLLSTAQLTQIFISDPFVDFNGDGRVRGRPFSGLLESLGPFLGISGQFNSPLPKRDPRRGQNFMREYFRLTGRDPETKWTTADAVDALRTVLGLR